MPKIIQKECRHHGLTDYVLETRGYYRCKKCRSAAVTKNRRIRKSRLVEHFGGKCELCGYDRCQEALEFHHIDPNEKEFAIAAKGLCRSWKKALIEANKCILVCSNCHVEVAIGLVEIPENILKRI